MIADLRWRHGIEWATLDPHQRVEVTAWWVVSRERDVR